MSTLPGYWMNETSGVLRPAIEAYFAHAEMTPGQIAAMRAYLRQWINAPAWQGDAKLDALRGAVNGLTDRRSIRAWLDQAEDMGIDPL
jgi:hypothetical protein